MPLSIFPNETMIPLWDKFLYDNQAITFTTPDNSDETYRKLREDAERFWDRSDGRWRDNGPRDVRWTEYRDESPAYLEFCICGTDNAKSDAPTYKGYYSGESH